jgi:tetratricopeptide (TPR) repeat protein
MNFICKNKKIKKLLDKDNADKAISYCKKLISQQKNIVLNSLILSQIYLIRHNLKAAIDTVESLVSSNINIIDKDLQFEVYKLLGDYYHKKEDYRSAFLNYQLALAIKRDDTLLLQKMALIYLGMNNYEKAENIFTYLAKIEPDNISIKCNITYLYIESHRFKEAEIF